jgi:hypothetical protein
LEVVPPFLKLLRDSEAEVRVAAAGKVACISNLLEQDAVRAHANHLPPLSHLLFASLVFKDRAAIPGGICIKHLASH